MAICLWYYLVGLCIYCTVIVNNRKFDIYCFWLLVILRLACDSRSYIGIEVYPVSRSID